MQCNAVMRIVHTAVFVGFAVLTTGMSVKSMSNASVQGSQVSFETHLNQDTIKNAVQDQQILQIEAATAANVASIAAVTKEIAAMRSSLDRFTGIGIGLGAALTALQGLLVIITLRNGKSR